jgi:hypothetical protein
MASAVAAAGSNSPRSRTAGFPAARASERDHQLEKLEFALAVALTRGDQDRTRLLRAQIDAIGTQGEEPGT